MDGDRWSLVVIRRGADFFKRSDPGDPSNNYSPVISVSRDTLGIVLARVYPTDERNKNDLWLFCWVPGLGMGNTKAVNTTRVL